MYRRLALHIPSKLCTEVWVLSEMVKKWKVSVHSQIVRRLVPLGRIGPCFGSLDECPHAWHRAIDQVRQPRLHVRILNKDGRKRTVSQFSVFGFGQEVYCHCHSCYGAEGGLEYSELYRNIAIRNGSRMQGNFRESFESPEPFNTVILLLLDQDIRQKVARLLRELRNPCRRIENLLPCPKICEGRHCGTNMQLRWTVHHIRPVSSQGTLLCGSPS